MGIKTKELLVVHCNNCDRELDFDDESVGVAVFESREEAFEMAEGCEWYVNAEKDFCRCPACQDIVDGKNL